MRGDDEMQIHDNHYQELYDILEKLKYSKELEKLSIKAKELVEQGSVNNDTYLEGMGYYYLAEAKFFEQDYLECIQLCWKTHFICERQSYPRLYALSCNLAGKAYCDQSDYHNAVTIFLQGYYIAKEHGYIDIESWILNNIGTLFFNLEHFEEAIRYFERALLLIEKDEKLIKAFHEIVIMNVISANLRLRKFDEVEYWTKNFYELFPTTDNQIVKTGMTMKRVLQSYVHQEEEFSKHVVDLVTITRQHWTGNYAVKVLLETSEFCMERKDYDLMKLCLDRLKEGLVLTDYRHRIQLSHLYIEMYRATQEKDKMLEELENYYMLSKQSHQQDKNIEFNGLKNKIILEREISAKKKLIKKNEELSAKTEKDPFTGLLNKTSFKERVEKKLAQQPDRHHTLFIIDVDDFKQVNDTYGHLVGDEVIKLLANSFVNTFRIDDYIGRIGGDEFCIYVEGIEDINVIHQKTETLRKEIENLYVPSNTQCKVSASIGVCVTNKPVTYQELFVKADKALYQSKKMGKNKFYIEEDM